jgi:hypothetical protein
MHGLLRVAMRLRLVCRVSVIFGLVVLGLVSHAFAGLGHHGIPISKCVPRAPGLIRKMGKIDLIYNAER